MTWKEKSGDGLRAVESMVAEAITFFRNRGHRRTIAIEEAALALGITPRRTRSIFDGESVAMRPAEMDMVFRRFLRHLDAQAEDYAQRSAAVKAKRRQMEMRLEVDLGGDRVVVGRAGRSADPGG